VKLFYYFDKQHRNNNSKCYAFTSSAHLRLFFTSNFKNDDKYLASPEIFCPPPPPDLLGRLRPCKKLMQIHHFWQE